MIAADSTISAKAISEKISEKVSEKMSEKMSEKNTNVERTIERDLAKLKKLDILIREGGRKDGEWILTELGLAVLEASKKQQEK